MVDINKVKKLRNETGLSFGQIKKALDESGGDEMKTKEILNKLGLDVASKRSSRGVGEGVIDAYVHGNKKVGSMVGLLCETDFVARGDDFRSLVHDISMHVAAMNPKDINELLGQPFIKDQSMTIQDLITKAILKLGENIKIEKFVVLEI
jgi:elongation factor Ts